MKRVTDRINVSVRDGEPFLINWLGRTYVVKAIVEKRVEKKLFSKREVFRLITDKDELEISSDGKEWKLDRVLDADSVA